MLAVFSRSISLRNCGFLRQLELEVSSSCSSGTGRHELHYKSEVPEIERARKTKEQIYDYGYHLNHHRPLQPLPRNKNWMAPVKKPNKKLTDSWRPEMATFGQNDYIDILGNGTIHPAQLQYHTPRWLRGFPGQHKANELVKLIHYRNLYKKQLELKSPIKWTNLCKRIKYLLKYHNYKKQDEMHDERNLGLWEPEPDYYFKNQERRTFQDTHREIRIRGITTGKRGGDP